MTNGDQNGVDSEARAVEGMMACLRNGGSLAWVSRLEGPLTSYTTYFMSDGTMWTVRGPGVMPFVPSVLPWN